VTNMKRSTAFVVAGYVAMLVLGVAIGYEAPHDPTPGMVHALILVPESDPAPNWLSLSLEIYTNIFIEGAAAGGILGLVLGAGIEAWRRRRAG
jgi:hypothetical protein